MIYKSKHTQNYTTLPNQIFNDLTDAVAIGILAYLLSRPADWITYKKQLYNHFSEGRQRIDNAFKLLEANGYIVGVQQIGADGKFTGFQWIVYDLPVTADTENRLSENRLPKNRQSENEQLLNKEILSKEYTKEENNKDIIYRQFKHLKITQAEFDLLCTMWQKESVDNVLDKIENYAKNKTYTSLYLTAKNWLVRDKDAVKIEPLPNEIKVQIPL